MVDAETSDKAVSRIVKMQLAQLYRQQALQQDDPVNKKASLQNAQSLYEFLLNEPNATLAQRAAATFGPVGY